MIRVPPCNFLLSASLALLTCAAPGSSAGNTTYFIDPAKGNDAYEGTRQDEPWKSFAKLNSLKLAPGDSVMIAPGRHEETLKPTGEGTATNPALIHFLPGVHEFGVERAVRLPMFVSNSCDAPKIPKPIGILVQNAKHLRLQGGGVDGAGKTEILYAGRMVEIFNDHSEDIIYSGLVFDLKRPTVSEFRVVEHAPTTVLIQVAEGSTYEVKDGKFNWTGDLGSGAVMVQQAYPEIGNCVRMGFEWNPLRAAEKVEDLGNGKVRLSWTNSNYGLRKGQQYHFRSILRDSVGVHNARCKDIVIRDCDFYALTNMGFVSQFTENITYQRLNVAPPQSSIRTCPAWGDIFQFSNCKGEVLVDSCRLSGMQDDAINCHGTHLRIIKKTADNQLLLRFMHPQTYGFSPFVPGDEIAVIKHGNLREYADNPRRQVTAVAPNPGDETGKDWLLTLDGPAPTCDVHDVVDNITWYPNLTATKNHISLDPVRGFLLTTRGKVLVEENTFHHCAMPAILIEDDAEGWFESGPVRDMTIRNNRFVGCGISINPQTRSVSPAEPVHENINIENNYFAGAGVGANSTKGLTIVNNRSPGGNIGLNIAASCSEVKMENNNIKSPK